MSDRTDTIRKWVLTALVTIASTVSTVASGMIISDRTYYVNMILDHDRRLLRMEGDRYTSLDAARDRADSIAKNTTELREIRDQMTAANATTREELVRIKTLLETLLKERP